MMTVFFLQDKILDPKSCWEDWISEGSLTKVRRKYTDEGTVNPDTGICPNESAIQKSAYNWVVSSPETIREAKERFFFECRERAIIPTEEMWAEKFYRIGKLLYYQRPTRMKNFIEEHGLQEYAKNN